MTTIAYRDGTMADDCQTTAGGGQIVSLTAPKCYSHNGNVLGVSGLVGDNLKILEWFLDGMKTSHPKIDEDSEGLIINADGEMYGLWENQFMTRLEGCEFYAIGSGSPIALGAMHMGATAIEAVEAAIEYDIYTGGEIMSFKIGESLK